jgi:small conductance mechanosensitive channel
MDFGDDSLNQLWTMLQALAVQYGFKLLGALAILAIGYWTAHFISSSLRHVMERSRVSPTLVSFAANLSYAAVWTFVVVAVLSTLGVQTASIVAVIGAAGLAISLALQGSLSNFAAGVLIIFFKPFKVGDLVEVVDVLGYVEEVQIFNTILRTRDYKTVIIPNSNITADKIVNYSKTDIIRVDLVFGIGYGDDLLKAKKVLQELLSEDERVLKNPAPTVGVLELGDSSVNLAVRPFVKVENYWAIQLDLTEQVKLRFDQEGISIPFPQRDLHLIDAHLPQLEVVNDQTGQADGRERVRN